MKHIEEPLIMSDDISPIKIINKKRMKKTSKYSKRKRSLIEIIKENNNFFITPTLRIYFDKSYYGGIDRLFIELSWFNWTFAIKLKN